MWRQALVGTGGRLVVVMERGRRPPGQADAECQDIHYCMVRAAPLHLGMLSTFMQQHKPLETALTQANGINGAVGGWTLGAVIRI